MKYDLHSKWFSVQDIYHLDKNAINAVIQQNVF